MLFNSVNRYLRTFEGDVGILQRIPLKPKGCVYIGKEANKVEMQELESNRIETYHDREMNEFDVLALDLINSKAYLCEVSTHLNGFNYGKGNKNTIEKLTNKFINLQEYAKITLSDFEIHYMFWAPCVPKGYLTQEIEQLEAQGLEAIINSRYTDCVKQLREEAETSTKDYDNPFNLSLHI